MSNVHKQLIMTGFHKKESTDSFCLFRPSLIDGKLSFPPPKKWRLTKTAYSCRNETQGLSENLLHKRISLPDPNYITEITQAYLL